MLKFLQLLNKMATALKNLNLCTKRFTLGDEFNFLKLGKDSVLPNTENCVYLHLHEGGSRPRRYKKHLYSKCKPGQAMFIFENVVYSATKTGAIMNILHLASEPRQREMWAVILSHPL